jgi:hypothetical protein
LQTGCKFAVRWDKLNQKLGIVPPERGFETFVLKSIKNSTNKKSGTGAGEQFDLLPGRQHSKGVKSVKNLGD